MKRLPHGSDLIKMGQLYHLVPESESEEIELQQSLENQGVQDSTSFDKNGINGRLDLPAKLKWNTDGAVEVHVTTHDRTIPAWFWLVEWDDGSGRRFAHWGTNRDSTKSNSWT